MQLSWKIARVAGIDVYLHPTFLLVLFFPAVLASGPLGVLLILSLIIAPAGNLLMLACYYLAWVRHHVDVVLPLSFAAATGLVAGAHAWNEHALRRRSRLGRSSMLMGQPSSRGRVLGECCSRLVVHGTSRVQMERRALDDCEVVVSRRNQNYAGCDRISVFRFLDVKPAQMIKPLCEGFREMRRNVLHDDDRWNVRG